MCFIGDCAKKKPLELYVNFKKMNLNFYQITSWIYFVNLLRFYNITLFCSAILVATDNLALNTLCNHSKNENDSDIWIGFLAGYGHSKVIN